LDSHGKCREEANPGNASTLAGAQIAEATPWRTAAAQGEREKERKRRMVKMLKVLKVLNF
jgi:hypothetical protein